MQDLWAPVCQFVAACERYLELPLNGNLYLTITRGWRKFESTTTVLFRNLFFA